MTSTPITALDISYGFSALAEPFEKVTDASGEAVNIQPMAGGFPVYLWVSKDAGNAAAEVGGANTSPSSSSAMPASPAPSEAVVAVQVIFGDHPAPAGFIKIPRDLSGGSATTRAYLTYKKAVPTRKDTAICGIQLLKSATMPVGEHPLIGRACAQNRRTEY